MSMKREFKKLSAVVCLLLAVFLAGCQTNEQNSIILSPVEVVISFLMTERNNNLDAWLETLHPGIRDRNWVLSPESNEDRLTVQAVWELSGEEAREEKNRILQSDNAKNLELKEHNLSIVYAEFNPPKSSFPFDGETIEWVFVLIRDNQETPWYIVNFGQGRGGIPNLSQETVS